MNTSPTTIDDKDSLKKPLCTPMVKKIDLHFPLGLEVTARNLKGVTIKDAVDAIYKQFKKKVRDACIAFLLTAFHPACSCSFSYPYSLLQLQKDDEFEEPYLAGFEWDKEESWTRFKVHQKKEGAPVSKKAAKAAKKGGEEE